MFTVGHISFHTPGAEISDGLADPAFFQKVMTSASPRKEQKRECSGDLEVGRGRAETWVFLSWLPWVMAFSGRSNNQAAGFETD